ncbi:Bifunctional arginine demethylase and lysyl-hydroxylase JMJD6 [Hondaea fermentalgiana]|uniref:Bifunctional arginine demethylase and lysyl-hydroxylase JMJD6 n=1 Tax=Hondaea fermentalgiana TaxID=2315210 RepID=A0A2R5GDB4_9STRA|nr:Bifunctional arginine demethylase and lysyl-hydroxylase JMJD6 [Hondaea fermentalgiana]|eukprot:GBG28299.1 Bifunctional arginine demethylase and lysyl-hydroxylase JMJD6 [Hondaea fermentalgiana]
MDGTMFARARDVGDAEVIYMVDRIHILDRKRANREAFALDFDLPRKPVVIEGAIESWPARRLWSLRQFASRFGDDIKWSVSHGLEDVDQLEVTMAQYVAYLDGQADEMPLYVFDAGFGEKAPGLLEEYSLDSFRGLFTDDLLSALDEKERPKYRWLVAGPVRTGAPWHKDPSYTSAWNALLQGRKRWALYPPGRTPPGVATEDDGEDCEGAGDGACYGEVSTPTSLRWFLDVYPQLSEEERPLEVIQEAGDTIFVPAGWWHLVLNLEDTVSVTQNFVSGANLRAAAQVLWQERGGGFVEHWAHRLMQQQPMLWTKKLERALLPLREGFESSLAYVTSFHTLEPWVDRLSAVLRHHGLVAGSKLRDPPLHTSAFEVLSRRLNPTFAHVESGLIIKFFSHYGQGDMSAGMAAIETPWEHDGWTAYQSEVASLLRGAAEACPGMPQLVAHGVYFGPGHGETWRWPYVVETRMPGISLGAARARLEREHGNAGVEVMCETTCHLATWLGAQVRTLHDAAPRGIRRSSASSSSSSQATTTNSSSSSSSSASSSSSSSSMASSSSSFMASKTSLCPQPSGSFFAGLPTSSSPGRAGKLGEARRRSSRALYQHTVPYQSLLRLQRRFALSAHWRKGALPRRLLRSMQAFVAANWDDVCSVSPRAYVCLHGDLQEENVMVDGDAVRPAADAAWRADRFLREAWAPLLQGEEALMDALVHRLVHVHRVRLDPDGGRLLGLGRVHVPAGLRDALDDALRRRRRQLRVQRQRERGRERERERERENGKTQCYDVFAVSEDALAAGGGGACKPGRARGVGVIDFGDAREGDALFDLVAVRVSALRCEDAAWARFLAAYAGGGSRQPRQQHAHVAARRGGAFSRVLTCLALLHPCGALDLAARLRPDIFEEASTWQDVAPRLFPPPPSPLCARGHGM